VQIPRIVGDVLDLGVGPEPVDPLALLRPKALRIVDRTPVHLLVSALVDVRIAGEFGIDGDQLVGHGALVSSAGHRFTRRSRLPSMRKNRPPGKAARHRRPGVRPTAEARRTCTFVNKCQPPQALGPAGARRSWWSAWDGSSRTIGTGRHISLN